MLTLDYALDGVIFRHLDRGVWVNGDHPSLDGPIWVAREQLTGEPRDGARIRLAGATCGYDGWYAIGTATVLPEGEP